MARNKDEIRAGRDASGSQRNMAIWIGLAVVVVLGLAALLMSGDTGTEQTALPNGEQTTTTDDTAATGTTSGDDTAATGTAGGDTSATGTTGGESAADTDTATPGDQARTSTD